MRHAARTARRLGAILDGLGKRLGALVQAAAQAVDDERLQGKKG